MAAEQNRPTRPPLRRPREGRMIAGVAAGIARTTGIDVTLVRIGFALTAIFAGPGFVAYLVLWVVMPEDPPNP